MSPRDLGYVRALLEALGNDPRVSPPAPPTRPHIFCDGSGAHLEDNFAQPSIYLLKQRGNDLSRENILRQAENLEAPFGGLCLESLLRRAQPITRPTENLREMRFNGNTWQLLDG